MASLKFIMHIDDDQPNPPSSRAGAPEHSPSSNTASPAPSAPGIPSHAYSSHVSGSSAQGQVTRTTSSPATNITTVPGKRPATSSSNRSGSKGFSALASGSRHQSPRRRSTTSNDSMDQTGYGSAASSSSLGGGLHSSNSPMRPMSGPTASDPPIKYTPITGRVSRARKGVPVHTCEICRPPKTFTRAEHLRRHQLSHQTPAYACTYQGCDRAFHRPDLLARHQSRHNEHEDDQPTIQGGGGGEGPGRQPSLEDRASHMDLTPRTASLSGMSSSANPSAPPSETPSTPNVSNAAPNQRSSSPGGTSNTPHSPGPMAGGGQRYGYSPSPRRPHELHYTAAPSFSVVNPSSSVGSTLLSATGFLNAVDSFQQPRTTPSVFATQGLSLPSLSIPDNNPPELYHPGPDASPWASSASDSTYSTPASGNTRHPRFWLGRHRSPTSTDWPTTNLLSPYPNPIASRDIHNPSRASLDSMAAPPPSMFAGAFPSTQFSTVAQSQNYGNMLDVPMTGFGSTEPGGQGLSPTSGRTFRRHDRSQSTAPSFSSTPNVSLHGSGTLVTPMVSLPTRMSPMETLGRQKDLFVDAADTNQWGGLGFDLLGGLGGGFGDASPRGTGSGSGLLAALDLPMTGCGMPGMAAPNPQLPRPVRAAIPGYIEIYWQRFHKLYPIVHRRSFELSSGNTVLPYAMAAVATQYLDTKEDRLRGNQLHEHAWQELKKIPQWDLQTMQAILLCEMFARFRGRKAVTRPSKLFESMYSRVLYSNNSMFDSPVLPKGQQEGQWQAWLDAEARRRLLTACFITDVHTSAYQQQRRAFDCTTETPSIPLTARSATLWEASSSAEWSSLLASDPEAGTPTFIPATDTLTPDEIQSRPSFDQAAILAMELLHLPRLSSGSPTTTTRETEEMDLNPLTRPSTTPGNRPTSMSTTNIPTLFPLPGQTQPLPHPSPRPQRPSSESRTTSLFPTHPRAATYLALHQTPLHDLLAVSGDTWIFSQKVLPATSFLEHQRRLKTWADGRHLSTNERVQSAPQATIHAARGILSFLSHPNERDSGGMTPAPWSSDLSDYWALYVCALIIWAFGHRGHVRGNSREDGSGMGTEEEEEGVLTWLRGVASMGTEEVVRARGRREAGGVVGLVRRRLESDCVGGRSRLYVDAVGVLKKLEEGVNWNWF